jgi:hypothetical protein
MKRVKDTLFVDLKYTILYRKLGFKEVKPDIYVQQYDNIPIRIESESQRYMYNGQQLPLKNYQNFVMLELLDRLHKQGYSTDNIDIVSERELHLIDEDSLKVRILIEEYGEHYQAMVASYEHSGRILTALYSSRLTGGLIECQSQIFDEKHEVYYRGMFERDIKPFGFVLSADVYNSKEYPGEFVVKRDVLTSYKGNEEVVHIPTGIVQIGCGAFWNNMRIKKVVIPSTVTSIHGDAFVYCENLEEILIPESVNEIGDDPFAGCGKLVITNQSPHFCLHEGVLFNRDKTVLIHYSPLKIASTYEIPESVTWIGKHSFYKCSNLKHVTIGSNVDFIGNNAFSDCHDITLINNSPHFKYVGYVLYNSSGTNVIHYSMGAKLKEVRLLENVRTIGRNSFWNCSEIERIIIPANVRQIGYNPFAYCHNLTFENQSPHYKVIDNLLYDATEKELVCCTTVGANRHVRLPNTVENIGRNAFTGCHGIVSIEIPDSVKYISRGAFSGCIYLKQVEIPKSVVELGDWCFKDCISLEEITIPLHIEIKANTFSGTYATIIRY